MSKMKFNKARYANIVSPKKGEVYLAKIPGKNRPVVIVDRKGDNVTYLKCTTKSHEYNSLYRIEDALDAGLDGDSYVNRGAKYEMKITDLIHLIGRLSKEDRDGLMLSSFKGVGVSDDIYDDNYQRYIANRYS